MFWTKLILSIFWPFRQGRQWVSYFNRVHFHFNWYFSRF